MSSRPFPPLAEVQAIFWRLISAPEGVAQGAETLRDEGALGDGDLAFLVRPDERLDATGRLDIYADMYFYRLRDCLAEDFPKLATCIGNDAFHNLVTDYLLAHPSRHYSLRELGRALPDFVADRGDPAQGDLARLEWARVDVFDERDAEPLTRDALLAGGTDLAVRLVPATRLLCVGRDALARWREETPERDAANEPIDVLVWRRGTRVLHRSLPPAEANCLRALDANGLTLAEIAEHLLASLPTDTPPERGAEEFASALERWTRDALLASSDGRSSPQDSRD